MITLNINVYDINNVLKIFNRVQILKYIGQDNLPTLPININDYTTISGIDQTNNREHVSDILLVTNIVNYTYIDPNGVCNNWYITRYYNSTNLTFSAWSSPILGDSGSLYYNPLYPSERNYTTKDKLIIDRVRILIGDPVGLRREYGLEAEAAIHLNDYTYEMLETGWPVSINMYGKQYIKRDDPSVNGYRYLKFKEPINVSSTTISGVQYNVDLWYYTFRFSDRQIMEAYDHCPPPPPLNMINCTQEIFILQTSYDLLSSESWEHINEDGALIKDEGSTYDPSAGLRARADMLSKLRKRLDDAIKANRLLGIVGVRVD